MPIKTRNILSIWNSFSLKALFKKEKMINQHIACIIDDDNINQFIIKRVVENHNFTKKIISFSNGQEAFDFLFNNQKDSENLPDIIFTDINMPIMDGWTFLEHFKTLKFDKNILIYLLSSSIDANDFEKSKTIPEVSGYLIKPIQNKEIENIISKLNNNNKF
jgi:CheY-like chemotaxis protein